MSRRADRVRGSTEDSLIYGAVLPVGLYLFTMLGFVSDYSYRRAAFFSQYSHGIYRYRLLARGLIAGTAAVLGHFTVRTAATPAGGLFTAFLVVGGISVAGLGLILYRIAVSGHPDALGPYLALVAFVVLSGYAVTPYDLPSYLLIAGTCVSAFGARPRPPAVCALVAVLATCTRESSFLAAAACLAVCWARDRPRRPAEVWGLLRRPGRDGQRWRNAAAVSVATTATYAALHLSLAGGGSRALWAGPGMRRNLQDPSDILGLLMALLAVVVVGRGYARLGAAPVAARARRAVWALSVPYLAVSLAGGIWFESPRLVAPVLICELLVIAGCRAAGEAPPVRSSESLFPAQA